MTLLQSLTTSFSIIALSKEIVLPLALFICIYTIHELLKNLIDSVKTESTMNRNLLIALLSVWWYVSPFSSAIKDGKAVKGSGSGLVTIFKLNTRVCNGILVDKSWILTAGKCIDDGYLNEYRLSIRTKDDKSIDRRVLYTERPANSDDVVLIKTTKALWKRSQKIVLGNSASDKEYIKCKLLGYSDVEQKPVKAFLKESAGCDNAGNKHVLCFDAKKASVCPEYTGAPVLCRTSQKRFLAGIASFEGRCSTKNIPGIRISFYERWIRQVLNAVDCAKPTINNGTVDLEQPGKSSFGAKASVICNTGFIASTTTVSCGSDGIWSSASCDTAYDCRTWRDNGFTTNGIYTVQLWKSGVQIQVYCDMQTDSGGWTVFQNRFDRSVDFYRNLSDYKNGFGNLNGEFWTGLRYVQEMAQLGKTELRFDLSSMDLTRSFYSVFQDFHLGSDNFYVLNVGERSGSQIYYPSFSLASHNGTCFSTEDRDCDGNGIPTIFQSSWWFKDINYANLNGKIIFHMSFDGLNSLGSSKMMFRRV